MRERSGKSKALISLSVRVFVSDSLAAPSSCGVSVLGFGVRRLGFSGTVDLGVSTLMMISCFFLRDPFALRPLEGLLEIFRGLAGAVAWVFGSLYALARSSRVTGGLGFLAIPLSFILKKIALSILLDSARPIIPFLLR